MPEMITLCQSANQKIPVSKKDVLPNIAQHCMTTFYRSKRNETKTLRNTIKVIVNPERKKEKVSRLILIRQVK